MARKKQVSLLFFLPVTRFDKGNPAFFMLLVYLWTFMFHHVPWPWHHGTDKDKALILASDKI